MKQSDKKIQIEDIVEPDFQPVFPTLVSFNTLKIEPKLTPIIIIEKHLLKQEQYFYLSIKFSLEIDIRVDVYLFINDIKCDVFYKIKKGEYSFNNIIVEKETKKIELFYVLGNKCSVKQEIEK